MRPRGVSVKTFAKKYELTLYILLLTSLRNTGFSAGNMAAALFTPEKAELRDKKKRAPLLF